MKRHFPDKIRFQWPWRSYQQRVLSELSAHLKDNCLHVVAAPGSGKTVLGLEVIRRLGAPAVILAPTVAIRDQWIERFLGLFCSDVAEAQQYVSYELTAPALITASTYQGLHRLCTGKSQPQEADEVQRQDPENASTGPTVQVDELAALLKKASVSTLVVDEAHHLRNEWWRVLIALKQALGKPTIVALTATPPYDVPPAEWEKYKQLCGPVDAEISVPQLVGEKNLCPHQDYVYISTPDADELGRLERFRIDTQQQIDALCEDRAFLAVLQNHPFIARPQAYLSQVSSDVEFFTAVAIFLHHVGAGPRRLFRALGIRPAQVPPLTTAWMETLLTGMLYTYRKDFTDSEAVLKAIESALHAAGAIERRKVFLETNEELSQLLATSLSKLKSIVEIVRLENATLKEKLRMVILTDFIRREVLPRSADTSNPIDKIGVAPLFEILRREELPGVRLGVLSGSMILLPSDTAEPTRTIARDMGIEPDRIDTTPLPHDPRYVTVRIAGADRHKSVTLITRLFRAGGVNVLIGTKSLLGEGWDAPSINTLVLASFVGSYMLSNQMRGRAIRSLSSDPDKIANIWHLLCVEADTEQFDDDFETLTRRFKSFEGVTYDQPVIQNGMDRLGLGRLPFSAAAIQERNTRTLTQAVDRTGMARQWQTALAMAAEQMVEHLYVPLGALPRRLVLRNGLVAFLTEASIVLTSLGMFLLRSTRVDSGAGWRGLSAGISGVALAVLAVLLLPRVGKRIWLVLLHLRPAWSLRCVGKIVLDSLIQAEQIKTDQEDMKIRCSADPDRAWCRLAGATTYEKSLFLDALEEVLGPAEDPRYVLTAKGPLDWLLGKTYYSIPREPARNKELAESFARLWKRRIGPAQAVYTRSDEGRIILLQARAAHLATATEHRTERVRIWQ
ncbi:MAG: DEAD/DEAH box helicase family protein [Sedimentisphaerales bacterium]|nr:DEAD/DEAH box helicase family protein [Sedimentisphaerales bacterium]